MLFNFLNYIMDLNTKKRSGQKTEKKRKKPKGVDNNGEGGWFQLSFYFSGKCSNF